MDACAGTTANCIFTGEVNGDVVSMLLRGCAKNPGTSQPEATAFRVIKDNDGLYSAQRAWRSLPSDQEVDDVMHALGKVTVCDTRAVEHPWLSCRFRHAFPPLVCPVCRAEFQRPSGRR